MVDYDMDGNNTQQPTMADLFQIIRDTQAQLGQLQDQIRDQDQENRQLREQVDSLRQPTQVPASTAATPIPTPSSFHAPVTKVKVPKPDLYYGDRKKTQNFLSQLNDYVHFSQGHFANEQEQVLYASTFLRGPAK